MTSADQYTDQINNAKQRVSQNNADLQRLQAAIASDQLQIPQLQTTIDQLTAKITTTQSLLDANRAILDHITVTLNDTQLRLAQAEAELAADKRQLSKELVIMYELQQQSTPLKNFMQSGNFNDFWSQLIDTERIGQQESDTVTLVQNKQAEIESDVQLIASEQAQQQQVVVQIQVTEQTLQQAKAAQQTALVQLQAREAADQQRQAEINQSNANLKALINTLNQEEAAAQAAASAGAGSGHFVWPDQGPISQGFGCTQFQFEAYDAGCPYPHRFHNGIDIAGACGNSIRAAGAGTVTIAPYDPFGFGNYILIQHGGGWMTLYGHMSGFAVGNGQHVGQGQLIGYEGSTGNSTGCHLHFGVNHNNQWLNPLGYLP